MPKLFVAGGCLLLAGCATLAHGRTQEVAIASDPPGARVLHGDQVIGVTPTRVILKRRESRLVLRFERDGFQPAEVPLKRTASGWIVGDLAFGPLQFANQGLSSTSQMATAAVVAPAMAVGIDLATGALYKLPSQVHVVLQPARTP